MATRDYYIGIDNGVSGSIGIFGPTIDDRRFYLTPVKSVRTYTKEEKHIHRVDVVKLRELFKGLPADSLVLLERPMVNPQRFVASMSAIRALEATLIVIEEFDFYLRYLDSREWQSVLLPGIEGSDELKAASLKLGKELWPTAKFKKDADSLLMAKWAFDKQL